MSGRAGTGVLATLLDLVLPSECGGCAAPPGGAGGRLDAGSHGVCAACATWLATEPEWVERSPPPPGLPRCVAVGVYAGPLRELILAYKERGRRDLARPLGDALATAVEAGLPDRSTPVVLVPVPDTKAAARARHGDHMMRMARRAAWVLRRRGRPAEVVAALWALPKDDSAHLDRYERAEVALASFLPRPAGLARLPPDPPGTIVLVDDVLTTGSTLAAVARVLEAAHVRVGFAATLAATELRSAARPWNSRTGPALTTVSIVGPLS